MTPGSVLAGTGIAATLFIGIVNFVVALSQDARIRALERVVGKHEARRIADVDPPVRGGGD